MSNVGLTRAGRQLGIRRPSWRTGCLLVPLVIAWLIFGLLPAVAFGSLAGQLMRVHWDVDPDLKTGVIAASAGVPAGTKLGIYASQPRGTCTSTAVGIEHCDASTAAVSTISCTARTSGSSYAPLGEQTVTPSAAHTGDELLYTVTAGAGGISIRCSTKDSDASTSYYLQIENSARVFTYRLIKALVEIIWAGGCAVGLIVGPMLWLRRRARRRAATAQVTG